VQTKDGLDPTPAEDERLERILSDHIAEYCQCGHKLGWGDIAWNTATTEAGPTTARFRFSALCATRR
jgi:hypothetical protein